MGRKDGDTVLPRLTDHSIADALAQATTGQALAPREGPVLLAHVLQRGRTWLIAHADTHLSPTQRAHFERLVRRRQHGEPLAYLVGEREFFGHRIAVSPSVLIPRPETELLVEWSITQLLPRAQVLELATGSGAVAIALALARPDCQILATDRSHCALAVARANARRLLAQTPGQSADRLQFAQGDWYGALDRSAQRFDCILANPPYVAQQDPHLQQGDLRFEPPGALASGLQGLDAIEVIVAGAGARLKPGGALMIEHGYDQGGAVRELMQNAGLQNVTSLRDLAGHDRVSTGVR
jgi:release factor glutamine methyltransferase